MTYIIIAYIHNICILLFCKCKTMQQHKSIDLNGNSYRRSYMMAQINCFCKQLIMKRFANLDGKKLSVMALKNLSTVGRKGSNYILCNISAASVFLICSDYG